MFFSAPQLRREPLDGALTHLIRWGKQAFVAATVLFLVRTRLESQSHVDLSNTDFVLMAASVLTLPFAAVSVWQAANSVSRRNWIILLGVCLILLVTVVPWRLPPFAPP